MEKQGIIIMTDMVEKKVFDAIEIHPVKNIGTEDEGTIWEQCEPEEADMWTVYVHYPGEGLEAIADCDTLDQAQQVKALMEHSFKFFSPLVPIEI
jgi:hypothetical protein